MFANGTSINDLANCSCTSHALVGPTIDPSLYIDTHLLPVVDRPKPQRPSTVYVTDGGCDPQFAQWECPTYAYDACEHLYKPTGFAEDYLQCLDDRFNACRRAAGCDYQFNLDAGDCDATKPPRPLDELVREACQRPDQEFSSWEAYQACVDRVSRWARDGCNRIEQGRFGGPANAPVSPSAVRGGPYGGPYNNGVHAYR